MNELGIDFEKKDVFKMIISPETAAKFLERNYEYNRPITKNSYIYYTSLVTKCFTL